MYQSRGLADGVPAGRLYHADGSALLGRHQILPNTCVSHPAATETKVELSMSLNTEIPEIPIRRHTHWFVSIRVCRNIGVTGGIVVTYIELSVRFRIMIDFGCRSQDHGRPAMRTAEGSTALGSGLSFFQNGHLLFCVLLEFTQKTGGYPPSL